MCGEAQDHLSRISTLWESLLQAHGADTEAARAAQAEILQRYARPVYRYLRKVLGDADAADEVFQEFALGLVRGDFRHADPRKGRFRDYLKISLLRLVSANQLALELQRYLADEPVQAGPPSVRYRAWKFCRRHRVPVAGAGLIAIALIGGLAGPAWGLLRAERAAAAERAARGLAEKRRSQLERGDEILTSVFADLDIRRVREGGEPLEAVLAGRLAPNTPTPWTP